MSESTTKTKKAAPWLIRLFQGMLVGVGGILPGVSGGVLCAIFGIYKPIMEVLAHPFKNLKKHFALLLPAGIGLVIGFLGLARLVELLLKNNQGAAVSVFVGLIFGMLPSLWREAGLKGRGKPSYIAMGIAFTVIFAIFMILKMGTGVNLTPNGFWYGVSGALWGAGVIVPGMSASSPLIFLGLYEPLVKAITSFDFAALVPFALGIAAVMLLLSRAVNYLLGRYHSIMYHAIFGIVIATTIPIIPYDFSGAADLLLNLACISGGFAAALLLGKLGESVRVEG